MVLPIGGAPDGTPNTRSAENENSLSYRELYNKAKGDKTVFMQEVRNQYGYSAENKEDNAVVLEIFGFLKSSDKNDGTEDGSVKTQQLIADLKNEKTEVEIKLRLNLEHNYGANFDEYYKIKNEQGDDAAQNYLKECIEENCLDPSVTNDSEIKKITSLYLMKAQATIGNLEQKLNLLDTGIRSTTIDEQIEKN